MIGPTAPHEQGVSESIEILNGFGRRGLAGLQAAYYVGTGLWSLVHRRSFERVTGPKREYWLVRTVGALAVAIGAALGLPLGVFLAVLVTQIDSERFTIPADVDTAHQPHSEKQRFRTHVVLTQLLFFNHGRLAALHHLDVFPHVAFVGPAVRSPVIRM